MMKHWRITKYNPSLRDSSGAFCGDDWTAFDDIGRAFGGAVLTMAEYQQMEDQYVNVAMRFANEANVSELVTVEVEERTPDFHLSEGLSISIHSVPSIIRPILRSQVWCKLECRPLFYLHFGYDYYMYIGSQRDLPDSVRFAVESGLFVEDEITPYLRWE
jgi:hypothetical protein